MNRISRTALLMLVLALGFLLGPFVVVFVAGFSGDETLRFPPQTFSWRWMAHVFTVEAFQRSLLTSLVVAFGSTLLALALGVPVAYALSLIHIYQQAAREIATDPDAQRHDQHVDQVELDEQLHANPSGQGTDVTAVRKRV